MPARYLTAQDYRVTVEWNHLLELLNGDSELLATAEERALREVRMRLADRYDLSAILYPILPYAPSAYALGSYVERLPTAYQDGQAVVKGSQLGWKGGSYLALKSQAVGVSLSPEDAPELWAPRGITTLYKAASNASASQIPGTSPVWQPVEDRASVIYGYMADIVVFHLYKRAGQMPDERQRAYDQACALLTRAGQGQADMDLPLRPTPQRPLGAVRVTSRVPKQGWSY